MAGTVSVEWLEQAGSGEARRQTLANLAKVDREAFLKREEMIGAARQVCIEKCY